MVSTCRRSRKRRQQTGFTLIEIMIVVIIIGVLAAIAIPAFTGETNRGKANTEVTAFFAELQVKEEQYRVDKDSYLAAPACPGSASSVGQSATGCVVSGQPWGPDVAGVRKLNVSLPTSTAFCSYLIVAGAGTGTNNPVAGFTFTSPAGNWYYIVATCDMDADLSNATFWTSSVDSSIQKQNEGE